MNTKMNNETNNKANIESNNKSNNKSNIEANIKANIKATSNIEENNKVNNKINKKTNKNSDKETTYITTYNTTKNKTGVSGCRIISNIFSQGSVSGNIRMEYTYTFLKNFDISSSIWVLYMVFKGMSLWQIGIVEAIYHLTSLLCEVPSGAMADLLGRKKVILAGRICSAISSLICLFSGNMWHFSIAFAVSAIGQNLNSGSEEALLYDSMKQLGQTDQYIKINSRLNVIIEIAQGIATVVGGLMAEYSFAWCYIVSVIVALLALAPAIFFVEPKVIDNVKENNTDDDYSPDNHGDKAFTDKISVVMTVKAHFINSVKVIQSDAALRRILLYYPMVFTFHTIVFFYGQEFFSLLGMNKLEISLIMLFAGVISILGALSSEMFLKCFGHKAKYVASILMGCSIIAMSRHNLILSILAFVVVNYANSVLYPIQSVAVNELIPSKQRATIISVNSMIFSILMVLLFPVCGLLADRTDLHFAFLLLGIVQLTIMIMIRGNKGERKCLE